MTAPCAHHRGCTALAPIHDGAIIKEIATDHLPRRDFFGTRDRIPALMETAGLLSVSSLASSRDGARRSCCHMTSVERWQADEKELRVLDNFELRALVACVDIPRRMPIQSHVAALDCECALRH